MRQVSCQASISNSLRSAVIIELVILTALVSAPLRIAAAHPPSNLAASATLTGWPGDEAPFSTLKLQMPFIAGEVWTVGGGGSFYGAGLHTNANNDYYATDWNKTNDLGAAVLPVADGTVSAIDDLPCPPQIPSYGCYVQIDHADGYRTFYAHLDDVLVANNTSVKTWTLIGRVGASGTNDPHLHLTFKRNDGGYFSRCWNNGNQCPNGEAAQTPQGHRPSPMATSVGEVTLVDGGTYTSVNGRVFLPDLRNKDSWTSEFYVRNDGTEQRSVTISYFKSDGVATITDTCVLNAGQRCWIQVTALGRIPAGTTGSAFVDKGEAVSVAVENRNVTKTYAHNGVGATNSLHTGWSQSGTTLYCPVIMNNYYGWYSELIIFNTGSGTANVSIYYRHPTNSSDATQTATVNAKGAVSKTYAGAINTLYAARILQSTSQPLVAVVRQYTASQSVQLTYDCSSAGATTTRAPLIMDNYYGWNTSVNIQNTTGTNATATLYYYYPSGSLAYTHLSISVPAYATASIWSPGEPLPAGFTIGAARVSSGQPLVVTVNQSNDGGGPLTKGMSYSGSHSGSGSTSIALPDLRNHYFQAGDDWITSVTVQNTTTTGNVQVWLNANGNSYPVTLGANGSAVYYLPGLSPALPTNWRGPGTLTATQAVSAVVNHSSYSQATVDLATSYNGQNR